MRSVPQALRHVLGNLPFGWSLPKDPASWTGRLLKPLAEAAVTFEQRAEAMLPEAAPLTASALLDGYERVLGPNPCLAARPVTLEERRRSAQMRWTRTGGASKADLIKLAADLGYEITIDEFRPARAGKAGGGGAASRLRAGGKCYPRAVIFTWRVHAPPVRVVTFKAGQGKAGQALRSQGIPWLECELRRAAPERTKVIFAYDGPTPVTDDRGMPVTDDQLRIVEVQQ